jgi:hypothetical protein
MPPLDYVLWRREYVFRDQWSSYLVLLLLYYGVSERALWIMLPLLGCIVAFNVTGYYYLALLESRYDHSSSGAELLTYLLWRREYLFRDAWLSYAPPVLLHYTVGQRKLFVVAPALLFSVLLNVWAHLSLYQLELTSGIYDAAVLQSMRATARPQLYEYLVWRRAYIFRDEWLCYTLLLTLYYVLRERRWRILGPAIACVIAFNSVAYHYLDRLEAGVELYE